MTLDSVHYLTAAASVQSRAFECADDKINALRAFEEGSA
jgi:hypothetical protein